jgi:hypothetical protein
VRLAELELQVALVGLAGADGISLAGADQASISRVDA